MLRSTSRFAPAAPCARTVRILLACIFVFSIVTNIASAAEPFDPSRGIVLHGKVVTMDSVGTVLDDGRLLVRNGQILAIWQGNQPPAGTPIGHAVDMDLGPRALIFPGLIDLHNHPTYDVLDPWAAPSSDVQSSLGRPLGTEPYANRYQWNDVGVSSPPEYRRLVDTPQILLNSSLGLGLRSEVVKYAQAKAVLGGETSFQDGSLDPATDNLIVRSVQSMNFGRQAVFSWVPAIDTLSGPNLTMLTSGMQNGQVDAWLVHLAEGVRDGQRRLGDTFSSRSEFATLAALGLLTDMTVIVQGNGLESADFTAMRAAPSTRLDGTGDGLGAKLVWSPLSNLLLYGQTALVYNALKEGVLVSLGTDWSPSGSRNLLDELKIADIALRDPRLLGRDRDLIPSLSVTGKTAAARRDAEIALDRLMVQMVTSNPATTLRWDQYVGSLVVGKAADLLIIQKPDRRSGRDIPDSPYRDLIDATERDVSLVLVNGEPKAGRVSAMETLKPGYYEVVSSRRGCFQKALDVTNASFPKGTESFTFLRQTLEAALIALGGDTPQIGGGTSGNSNTYSYLKAHIPGAEALTDAQFRAELTYFAGTDTTGNLNLEGIQLSQTFVEDDHFYFHLIGGDIAEPTGLIEDFDPPYGLYPTNLNQIQGMGNPFGATEYRYRYFDPPSSSNKRCAASTSP